jgi:hypothetical protein
MAANTIEQLMERIARLETMTLLPGPRVPGDLTGRIWKTRGPTQIVWRRDGSWHLGIMSGRWRKSSAYWELNNMRLQRVSRRSHKDFGTFIVKSFRAGNEDVFLVPGRNVWTGSLAGAQSRVDWLVAATDHQHVCSPETCPGWEAIQQPEPLAVQDRATVAACFFAFKSAFEGGRDYSAHLESLQREYYGRSFELVDGFENEQDKRAALRRIGGILRQEIGPPTWREAEATDWAAIDRYLAESN